MLYFNNLSDKLVEPRSSYTPICQNSFRIHSLEGAFIESIARRSSSRVQNSLPSCNLNLLSKGSVAFCVINLPTLDCVSLKKVLPDWSNLSNAFLVSLSYPGNNFSSTSLMSSEKSYSVVNLNTQGSFQSSDVLKTSFMKSPKPSKRSVVSLAMNQSL